MYLPKTSEHFLLTKIIQIIRLNGKPIKNQYMKIIQLT